MVKFKAFMQNLYLFGPTLFAAECNRALFDNVSAEIGKGHLAGYSGSIKQRSGDTDKKGLDNTENIDRENTDTGRDWIKRKWAIS